MATALTYTSTGAKAAATTKLDKQVFEVMPSNHTLLKEAYVAYLGNGRLSLATTKTRGEVSGGGKKPWRQKGTGRARFGSSRNPIWRGGGIVFGPTGNENYTKHVNVKAKRLALRQALSLAADEKRIVVLEDLKVKDAKTSALAGLLAKVGATRSTLLVVEAKTDELLRASRNLQNVKLVNGRYLNVYDLLNADTIVVTKAALEQVVAWLGDTAKGGEQ
ncbi:MAG TPA: 50S ribosomal protein L4 [Candidatus Saccharimonadales bacterium]|nr:50S ribosomal protein L4 [Candidatus Saccharimonadales bacterium]